MKNITLIIIVFVAISLGGCKKDYVGDTYDFSDSKAPYVELASKKAISVKQGATVNITIQMKTALTEDVTVTYSITGTSATIGGPVIILRNTVKTVAPITIPDGIVAVGSTVAAQLTLVSATKGADVLRIGSIAPTSEVLPITITP